MAEHIDGPDAGTALELAQRRQALWQVPLIADSDIPVLLDVPVTLWNQQKTIGDTPPLFTIGRRLFVRTADLRQWIDAKAATGAPGSKRLRQRAARGEA